MKRIVTITIIISLLIGVAIVSFALSNRVERALVGRWVDPDDPENTSVYQRNGIAESEYTHAFGRVNVVTEFSVDTSYTPNRIRLIFHNFYLDGRIMTIGPQPGDEIHGIIEMNGDCYRSTFNEMEWGADDPYPTSFEDAEYDIVTFCKD